jgi:hypothetical protein
MVAAWSHLFGTISFELFGHFDNVVADREAFFEHTVTRIAHEVGLRAQAAGTSPGSGAGS